MNSLMERLQTIRVADVMSRGVVTVAANSTMAEAAKVLAENEITGAPVVNELNQCIGILSTTDFARRDSTQQIADTLSTPAGEFQLEHDEGSGEFRIEHEPKDLVSAHMSYAPQTIDAGQSLIDAARYMQREHIHRLLVLDDEARQIGVVSSLDIMSALVKIADEMSE